MLNVKSYISRQPNHIRVIFPNSLTSSDATILAKEVISMLSEDGDLILVDFVKTSILYSAGFNALIMIRKAVINLDGNICLINVSNSIKELFEDFNLTKIFKIYSTETEFELDTDGLWKNNMQNSENSFIFLAQVEHDVYRITLSGFMATGWDFLKMREFTPDSDIKYYVFNFENTELVDSFGAQEFANLVAKIEIYKGEVIIYGVKDITKILFNIFPELSKCIYAETEQDALALCK